jgi:hypothetical protein
MNFHFEICNSVDDLYNVHFALKGARMSILSTQRLLQTCRHGQHFGKCYISWLCWPVCHFQSNIHFQAKVLSKQCIILFKVLCSYISIMKMALRTSQAVILEGSSYSKQKPSRSKYEKLTSSNAETNNCLIGPRSLCMDTSHSLMIFFSQLNTASSSSLPSS